MTVDVLQFIGVVTSGDCETDSKCTKHPLYVYNNKILVQKISTKKHSQQLHQSEVHSEEQAVAIQW